MDIKIYGPGCVKCHQMHEMVLQVLAEQGIAADLEYVTDITEISKAGIMRTPTLVVDGKIIVAGRLPKKKEMAKLLANG
ncbi:MAG: thioredoxin family protein [Candidatus Geothermincolia bacterium]